MYWLKAGFLLLLLFPSFCLCAIKSTSQVNAFQRCVDEAIQQFPASSSLQSHQLIFKIRTFLNNFQQNISYLEALSEAKRTRLLDEICAVCIAYMRLEPSVDIAAPDGSDKQTVTDLYRQKVAGLVAVSITEAMDLFCSDNTMSLLIIAQLVCIQGLESNSVLETFLETITRTFSEDRVLFLGILRTLDAKLDRLSTTISTSPNSLASHFDCLLLSITPMAIFMAQHLDPFGSHCFFVNLPKYMLCLPPSSKLLNCYIAGSSHFLSNCPEQAKDIAKATFIVVYGIFQTSPDLIETTQAMSFLLLRKICSHLFSYNSNHLLNLCKYYATRSDRRTVDGILALRGTDLYEKFMDVLEIKERIKRDIVVGKLTLLKVESYFDHSSVSDTVQKMIVDLKLFQQWHQEGTISKPGQNLIESACIQCKNFYFPALVLDHNSSRTGEMIESMVGCTFLSEATKTEIVTAFIGKMMSLIRTHNWNSMPGEWTWPGLKSAFSHLSEAETERFRRYLLNINFDCGSVVALSCLNEDITDNMLAGYYWKAAWITFMLPVLPACRWQSALLQSHRPLSADRNGVYRNNFAVCNRLRLLPASMIGWET